MLKALATTAALTTSALLCACNADGGSSSASSVASGEDPRSAFGIGVGETAPNAILMSESGDTTSLSELYVKGPVVVTFYRGEWCPFCMDALKGWQEQLQEIQSLGATFVAISPEKLEPLKETIDRSGAEYLVLSDTTGAAAQGFGVWFGLDDSTVSTYKGYGIDLERTNVSGTWNLPHPGTFIVDREGVVRYAFVREGYKSADRARPADVVRALREIVGTE